MRKQKIMGLYRRHAKPKQGPLYVRFGGDGMANIRTISESEMVLELAQVPGGANLRIFPYDPHQMSIDEISDFLKAYASQLPTILDPSERIYDNDDPDRPDPATFPTDREERRDRTLQMRLYREVIT